MPALSMVYFYNTDAEGAVANVCANYESTINTIVEPPSCLLNVCMDYDGDGYDEVGIWQPHTNTWWVRNMPSGPNLGYTFGTSSGIPLPADYDNDGRIDLAYWEPEENRIYVSFDFGKSIGRTISVPPHSIPVFVNMY